MGVGGALILIFQPYYYYFIWFLVSPGFLGCPSFTVPSTWLAQNCEFHPCLFQLFLTIEPLLVSPHIAPHFPTPQGEESSMMLIHQIFLIIRKP